jgi:lipopolysaccharide export system protein LptC
MDLANLETARADARLQMDMAPRRTEGVGRLARRGRAVRVAKYLLPVVALALLSSIALWPELSRTLENGRVTWRRLTMVQSGTGTLLHPRYRGMDEHGQPYVVSADTAQQVGPERVNLKSPRGDVTMHNGVWLDVRGKKGVYMQHADQLDLSQDVMLYRQDGTILTSDTATLDMKRGAATSADYTHAEGPFGTLDAQGFTLVDKGGIIQFHGPAKLVLNGNK